MTTEQPRARRMTRSTTIIVAAFLTVQIGLPVFQLAARWVEEGPQPGTEYLFSYQMYSANPMAHYYGVDERGVRTELSTQGLPLFVRAISYDDTVPKLLCTENPDLVTIERVKPGGEFPC